LSDVYGVFVVVERVVFSSNWLLWEAFAAHLIQNNSISVTHIQYSRSRRDLQCCCSVLSY